MKLKPTFDIKYFLQWEGETRSYACGINFNPKNPQRSELAFSIEDIINDIEELGIPEYRFWSLLQSPAPNVWRLQGDYSNLLQAIEAAQQMDAFEKEEGQDRESYSDEQDRENYTTEEPTP